MKSFEVAVRVPQESVMVVSQFQAHVFAGCVNCNVVELELDTLHAFWTLSVRAKEEVPESVREPPIPSTSAEAEDSAVTAADQVAERLQDPLLVMSTP